MTEWTLQKWFKRTHKDAPTETYVITFRKSMTHCYVHIYKIDGKANAKWFGTSYEEVIRAVRYFSKAQDDILTNEYKFDYQSMEIR